MLKQITVMASELSVDELDDATYRTINSDLRSFDAASRLAVNNPSLLSLKGYVDLVDQLVEKDQMNPFMSAVANVLFEIPPQKLGLN